MTPEKAFGHAVREFRSKRKLSQEELAFKSGYHRTYISLLERGHKSPSLAAIFRIANALQIPPTMLIEATEERNKPSPRVAAKDNDQ